jgi:hypothetical protein
MSKTAYSITGPIVALKSSTANLIADPTATFKAMGEDLVVVNETKGKVVVLNYTAKVILEGIRRGDSDDLIVSLLRDAFVADPNADLFAEIQRVRNELVNEGVLVNKKADFETPRVSVRDLKSALKDMDLSRASVSQYE